MRTIALWALAVGCALAAGFARAAPPTPEAVARRLISDLVNRRHAEVVKLLTPSLQKKLTAERLAEMWNAVLAKTGPFKSAERAVVKSLAGRDAVIVGCVFERARMDIKVAFEPSGKVFSLLFGRAVTPGPAWAAPGYGKGAFEEKDVKLGKAPFVLPGKLCVPKGEGPFPAVVLVHGSGPNDMDEAIGPNKPFKDLAWGLASHGIVVLRYDKRTRVHPDKIGMTFTVKQEVIEDARVAVALLASNPKVNAKKIVVLGHSLGGWAAPRIALEEKQLAGLIIMAGPTREFGEVLLAQLKLVAPNMLKEAEVLAKQIRDPKLKPEAEVLVLGVKTHGAYWIDYRSNPPTKVVGKVKLPMLVLQGGRDYQVIKADLDGWKKALKGRKNVTFKLYESLNHLFMAGKEKSAPAEYMKLAHVDEQVVKEIAEWIKAR
jgi:uncharacterized protein